MFKTLRKVHVIYVFTDLMVMGMIFYSSYFLYFSYIFKSNLSLASFAKSNLPNFNAYSFIFSLWAMLTIIFLRRRGLYFTDRSLSMPREMCRVCTGVLYASILVGTAVFFAKYKFFSRQIFLVSFFLLCIFLSGWRMVKRAIVRKLISGGFHNVNILIVGAGNIGRIILEEIKRNPYWGFNVTGFLDDSKDGAIDDIPVLGKLNKFDEVAKKHFIDEVIVTVPSAKEGVSKLINQMRKMHLGLKIVPEDFKESLPALDIVYLGITPLLTYKERKRHPAEFAFKRLFDFSVSLILLTLLSPLFLIISTLIKLSSPGSVFYIQKRSGFKGKVFNFYKFRSMVKEAEELKATLADKNESKGDVIFKIKRDPRITATGRFLRKLSLDELSQLINVLKGDMSLVGPRPFPVEESQKLEYNHMERLTVRPGITGLAQIRGRSDLSFYRWVKWDLWYINNWSFWLDLKILWRTMPVVLKGKGAY